MPDADFVIATGVAASRFIIKVSATIDSFIKSDTSYDRVVSSGRRTLALAAKAQPVTSHPNQAHRLEACVTDDRTNEQATPGADLMILVEVGCSIINALFPKLLNSVSSLDPCSNQIARTPGLIHSSRRGA